MEHHPISYGTMPGSAKPVSRIFFGTACAPMLRGEDCAALLDSMTELGITAFDTARGYGLSERVLGQWMSSRGNREQLTILSKCGDLKDGVVHLDRAVIEQELAQSLRELQTDYIDLYLLHRDDPNTPIAEYIDCLNAQKRAGKIRAFGVSNWTIPRIEEANAYAKAQGLEGFTLSSPHFSLAEQVRDPWGGGCVTLSGASRGAERQWYRENQLPVVSYSSLSRGFFSGKFRADDLPGAQAVLDAPAQRGYLCEHNLARLARAEVLAERDGCTVAQIALRFIFGAGLNLYAVLSTARPERMQENIDALGAPLCEADMRFLIG